MNNRPLSKNSFIVSEVGLGCWQIGADWGGAMEKETAFSILSEAVAQGVNFFDTADVYGSGRSEELIGEFIRNCDSPIRVATKFGRDAAVYPDKYSESLLRESVEASLARLGLDSLDLLQLHCVPLPVLQDGAIFDWLRKLQEEGLIQHFGASVESVEEALVCIEENGLTSLQVIFNVFRQKLISELLPKAVKKDVGIIVRLPLASGLLSGKFSKESTFADNDHRHYNRDGQCFNVGETFAGLPFETGLELVDQLKTMRPSQMSMAQMALRWILDHDAVSTIIPGASSAQQIQANALISEQAPLPKELHQRVSAFYAEHVHQHIRGSY